MSKTLWIPHDARARARMRRQMIERAKRRTMGEAARQRVKSSRIRPASKQAVAGS